VQLDHKDLKEQLEHKERLVLLDLKDLKEHKARLDHKDLKEHKAP
jgi:hypothetical protein